MLPVCWKSAATAGGTAATVTVIVVGSLDGCDSSAVTCVVPFASRIERSARRSVTVGVSSSSVILSSRDSGWPA